MLINQDFSVDRTKFIGGSDIGAILGLSAYRTPLQVWMEKTGKPIEKSDSLPLRFGTYAEDFVAKEYARATGFELIKDESTHFHPTYPFISAHIDRFVLEDGQARTPTKILECKTANPFAKEGWGEAKTDQIPMSYLCQCIWYMAITQIDATDLAVLFGNSDFRIYEISRDRELENLVIEKANHFWNAYVLKDVPPPAQTERDYQSLFSKGDPSLIQEAKSQTLEMLKRVRILNEEIVIRENELSAIKQEVMNTLGPAETLSYQGKVLATWRAPKPSFRIDAKRLEKEQTAIYQQYQIMVQNSRRLVIKEANV
jgi:putative phage-type endonuclease